MNRTLVGDIATLHLAPTRANAENLRRESVQGEIFITGNTVIDAMKTTVRPDFVFEDETLNRLDFPEKQVINLTCHRREKYGAPMEAILTAVRTIVEENPNVEVVYPVHLSPVVQDLSLIHISASSSSPRKMETMARGASLAPRRWSLPAEATVQRSQSWYSSTPLIKADRKTKNCAFCLGAVSYTHLDVYKRQSVQ